MLINTQLAGVPLVQRKNSYTRNIGLFILSPTKNFKYWYLPIFYARIDINFQHIAEMGSRKCIREEGGI
jgi:hypothetical protein